MKRHKFHFHLSKYRFEFLLTALLFLIFDKIFFPDQTIYLTYVWPLNMLLVSVACFGVFDENTRIIKIIRNVLSSISILMPFLFIAFKNDLGFIKLLSLFFTFYYFFIFIEVMRQITRSKEVGLNVIFGSFSGYLLLALITLFTFILIELGHPQSFHGIAVGNPAQVYNDLSYFSFITLTSIGFGDIYPLTDGARLTTAFFGMIGQFYMVALVGILISRFSSK